MGFFGSQPGKYAGSFYSTENNTSMSPHAGAISPSTFGGPFNGLGSDLDTNKYKEEARTAKLKLSQWDESMKQARSVSTLDMYNCLCFLYPKRRILLPTSNGIF